MTEDMATQESPRRTFIDRIHPVKRYINKPSYRTMLREGRSRRIPTGLLQRTRFTQGNEKWVTNLNLNEYREEIFADQFGPAAAGAIDGGEEDALAPRRKVLEIGSGQAVALLQYAQIYKQTTFIGVDINYKQSRKIDLSKTGVQLTKDDWKTLSSIPTGSIDTILCVRSVFPWGINPESSDHPEFLDAVTRVAKEGATWRFEVSPQAGPHIIDLLDKKGWDVEQVRDLNGIPQRTMVATKRSTISASQQG